MTRDEWIAATVAQAPPLRTEQIATITRLFGGLRTPGPSGPGGPTHPTPTGPNTPSVPPGRAA